MQEFLSPPCKRAHVQYICPIKELFLGSSLVKQTHFDLQQGLKTCEGKIVSPHFTEKRLKKLLEEFTLHSEQKVLANTENNLPCVNLSEKDSLIFTQLLPLRELQT